MAFLYDVYSTVVYSVAMQLLRDPALAVQILSDIFQELERSPKSFWERADDLSASLAIRARNRVFELLLSKPASGNL